MLVKILGLMIILLLAGLAVAGEPAEEAGAPAVVREAHHHPERGVLQGRGGRTRGSLDRPGASGSCRAGHQEYGVLEEIDPAVFEVENFKTEF